LRVERPKLNGFVVEAPKSDQAIVERPNIDFYFKMPVKKFMRAKIQMPWDKYSTYVFSLKECSTYVG
jgi:hypothetical protein